MYINRVKILNYRNFRQLEAELHQLTIIIGENDSGKSNFFTALSLPLSGNQIDFNYKRLNISDINTDSILEFYASIISNEDKNVQLSKIPKVSVTLDFTDPRNSYETAIISQWIISNGNEDSYRIRYDFKPKNDEEFLQTVTELLENKQTEDLEWFTLPIELYEYQIVSVNNEKVINFNELKHISINNINADRDDFSESHSTRSNGILTKLLINKLNNENKNKINNAYLEFFSSIKETKTFEKVIGNNTDFSNFHDFIEKLECTPNLPNLKNILSNITLRYGNEFLYQKGLGKRNLIYIIILFAYYNTCDKGFNLCCIEEPESHLSVNNLKLIKDFLCKSNKKENHNTLLQTIISTHTPSVINKLEITNVLAFSGDKAINLYNTPSKLVDYLRKKPNFDILKLLFANKVILVEGTTEEMLINTFLIKRNENLNNIEVIAIGQKGYRNFLDIWLQLNKDNREKKIGIIRDFDNQQKAKEQHHKYDDLHENIIVRTTEEYTLENDLVSAGDNLSLLSNFFGLEQKAEIIVNHLINGKAEQMLKICDAILKENDPLAITLPGHIEEVIKELS
ncbi:ATP-dependent nuclease [Arsenophonus nasoniae]|uniref:AAA family ATPase n=1 Tax=Arsenophonus nasoniae TaxID=638 RepID=A0AA95GBF8_9GAMM|nr:AAA family ATPase [Arsenophonus nasoniae]WGL95107.1 AAA family ATPase [Arsenophonus nasoniae]